MKTARAPETGKALVLGSLCFVAGWLWHRPEPPPPLREEPPCPVCPATSASVPAQRPQKLAAPIAPSAPARPEDFERLRECFVGASYRGSRFVLRLHTGNRGEVIRTTLLGDEFMEGEQRACVRARVKNWRFGANVDEDVVLSVVL